MVECIAHWQLAVFHSFKVGSDVGIPREACENVASDFGLAGGFSRHFATTTHLGSCLYKYICLSNSSLRRSNALGTK